MRLERGIASIVASLLLGSPLFGSEKVLMVSYGPLITFGLQGEPPPISGIYRSEIIDKWDWGVTAGDFNLFRNGTRFISADILRYFGGNNSGFTTGISYEFRELAYAEEDRKVYAHSFPIGVGYLAKWKLIVHDFYVGYGPSFRRGKVYDVVVAHLGIGMTF
jgi:hypothetical protein